MKCTIDNVSELAQKKGYILRRYDPKKDIFGGCPGNTWSLCPIDFPKRGSCFCNLKAAMNYLNSINDVVVGEVNL